MFSTRRQTTTPKSITSEGECPSLVPGCPCLLPPGHKGLHECVIRQASPLGDAEFDLLWSTAYIGIRDRGFTVVPGAEA